MRNCPLCGGQQRTKYSFKTYETCVRCQHTYQPEPPPKTWLNQNPEQEFNGFEGATMGNQEKGANKYLAQLLYDRYEPKSVLDIGCAYPYLAYCFQNLGVKAHAIDGVYKEEGKIENDLPVTPQPVDWELLDEGGYKGWKGVDLITMIHTFEHFADPIACLKRAYVNLSDNGVLFIRSPNKDVSGIERDHTEYHAAIHPNIFGNESFLYAAKKAGFYPVWVDHMNRYGQSSWVFKKHPPKVSLFMIMKNEEENILNCLKSVEGLCDEIIIVDTGSTDKSIEIAEKAGATVHKSKYFDEHTKFEDFDFSKARNETMAYCTGDWLFWMDADDVFVGDKLELPIELDCNFITIHYGDMRFNHARTFRRGWSVRFEGGCHEWPVVDQCRQSTMKDCHVVHKCAKRPNRLGRNIAILEREYEEDPNNLRAAFYLANAYREASKPLDAIKVYRHYIQKGGNFQEELFLAQYYVAMCFYQHKEYSQAIKEAHLALAIDDRWAEAYCCIGECNYFLQKYQKAICYLMVANQLPYPKTGMFVRREMYNRIPRFWLSHCYEQLGDLDSAKLWAKGDEIREKELAKRVYVIEVQRVGALGDVLCTTPAVHELRKKYPQAHIRYVTHKSTLPILQCNPDIDEVVEVSNKYADRRIAFSYPMHEGYPDAAMNRHLVQYFAECANVSLPPKAKPILNLLPDDTVKLENKKPIIAFAVKTGWSKYKEWPFERWEELIKLFPDYQFIQIGAKGEPIIKGAQNMCGQLTLRESFSLQQQSDLFIGLDSVFNHSAAALEVPSVIMFGSTSPLGSGYPQHTNLWGELECSPCYRENNSRAVHKKSACPYDHKCMVEFMTLERVANAVRQKLNIQHEQKLPVCSQD